MFDFIENVFDNVVDKADRFIDNPIGETIDTALAPVNDTLIVLDGLTEGELRFKAAARLGVDAVSGMALSELIEVMS